MYVCVYVTVFQLVSKYCRVCVEIVIQDADASIVNSKTDHRISFKFERWRLHLTYMVTKQNRNISRQPVGFPKYGHIHMYIDIFCFYI